MRSSSSGSLLMGLMLLGHAAAFGVIPVPAMRPWLLASGTSMVPRQCLSTRASLPQCLTSLGSSGGGISGVGGGGGGGGGGGDSGGDGNKLPAEVLAALGGRSLPDDLAAAAAAGRIGVAEVTSWLKVQDNAVLRLIAQISGAMRNRLIANERFFPTLAIEIAVGVLTKMTAEVVERNKRDAFWKELDFVASDMALEVLGDFGLVFLLAPTAAIMAPSTAGLAGAVAKLPSFFLQKGSFTATQRAACFAYKASCFWFIGFITSALGHSVTKALIEARGQSTAHMASVWDNSVQWGNFLGASSNLRYQLISSWEANLLPKLLPSPLGQTVGSTAVRLANCYSGGVQWLLWTRLMGIQ